jgi:hypothetical protein
MKTRWPTVFCRFTSATLAVLAVAQPVLAGGFLSGHYDLVKVHLYGGVAMIAVALFQTVAVIIMHRTGGPARVLGIGIALPVLLLGQAALGMTRILLLHIPLGVLMVVGMVRMAGEIWRPESERVVQEEAMA